MTISGLGASMATGNEFEELIKREALLLSAEKKLEKEGINEEQAEKLSAAIQLFQSDPQNQFDALRDVVNTVGPRIREHELKVYSPATSTENEHKKAPEPQEQWVTFTNADHVGLAFSGGGIRSATFNLGLLKGLDDLGILRHIDYVSTVSGGGYIAAWWTAWRTRHAIKKNGSNGRASSGSVFPKAAGGSPSAKVPPESAEVRHLRRFSNFLVPRWGFFEVEFWNVVVAFLSGLIPSLAIAISVLALGVWLWLLVAWLFFGGLWRCVQSVGASDSLSDRTGCLVSFAFMMFLCTLFILSLCEYLWIQCLKKCSKPELKLYAIIALCALLTLVGASLISGMLFNWQLLVSLNSAGGCPLLSFWRGLLTESSYAWLFVPSLAWLLSIVLLVLARFFVFGYLQLSGQSLQYQTHSADLSARRVYGRLTALAAAWSVIALLWIVASLVKNAWPQIVGAGGVGAGSFVVLKQWIPIELRPAQQVGYVKRIIFLAPQVLAYFVLGLALLAVCIGIQYTLKANWWWLVPAIGSGIIGCALLFFDPVNVGLHAFYRDRICRAYLGASNKPDDLGAFTDVQLGDDLALNQVRRRPLHLICCAANELDCDPLLNLDRGARSAVLSRLGLNVGNKWSAYPDMKVSSAITASAAAFNSNMGSISKELGPAVSFLMSALSLRLGIWVRRPGIEKGRFPPGTLFFKEMLSWSDRREVHMSDGAHFENLGLYELVRRHCRYIIVSDCGADSDVEFDDLSNCLRRIREDFGVEIELDTSPLKPDADCLAQQHMVVGTVHYDHRLTHNRQTGEAAETSASYGSDKGIILYLKPNLTGDEPTDVRQYHSRNNDFPNETTRDQFYDEAQWESYRRLGEHAAAASLGFLKWHEVDKARTVFVKARWKWYPTPPKLPQGIEELSARFAEMEENLRTKAPWSFRIEIYPELKPPATPLAWQSLPPTSNGIRESMDTLQLLVQMIELMQDAWLILDLQTHWNHPQIAGWMNLLRRWSGCPTFWMWWPMLKANFCEPFRNFVHLALQVPDKARREVLSEPFKNLPGGLAQNWWKRLQEQQRIPTSDGYIFYDWTVTVSNPDASGPPQPLQLAALRFQLSADAKTATWNLDDLFVLPYLWASGVAGAFLDGLLKRWRNMRANDPKPHISRTEKSLQVWQIETVRVNLRQESLTGTQEKDKRVVTDQAARAVLSDTIGFYKSRGFYETTEGYLECCLNDGS